MANKKWLVRGGALLVLLGFVLPTMTVSCGGMVEYGRTVSLYELITLADTGLLYLVPLGALAVIILAFLPASDRKQNQYFYWGQVAGTAIGLLSMLIALSTLRSQIGEVGFDISPEIGALVLAAGYGLTVVGLAMAWPEVMNYQRGMPDFSNQVRQEPTPGWPTPDWSATPQMRQPDIGETNQPTVDDWQDDLRASRQAHTPGGLRGSLRLVEGDLPRSTIALEHDNITIGRGSACDLFLEDRTVSRQHARLRYAQGAWFIQDEQSTAGTYVNERKVAAKRLEDGDEIKIGDYRFIFREM